MLFFGVCISPVFSAGLSNEPDFMVRFPTVPAEKFLLSAGQLSILRLVRMVINSEEVSSC